MTIVREHVNLPVSLSTLPLPLLLMVLKLQTAVLQVQMIKDLQA